MVPGDAALLRVPNPHRPAPEIALLRPTGPFQRKHPCQTCKCQAHGRRDALKHASIPHISDSTFSPWLNPDRRPTMSAIMTCISSTVPCCISIGADRFTLQRKLHEGSMSLRAVMFSRLLKTMSLESLRFGELRDTSNGRCGEDPACQQGSALCINL